MFETHKPSATFGRWRYRVVRGWEGHKHVPAARQIQLDKQLHEDKDHENYGSRE